MEARRRQARRKARYIKGERRILFPAAPRARGRGAEGCQGHGTGAAGRRRRHHARGRDVRHQGRQARRRELLRDLHLRRVEQAEREAALRARAAHPEVQARGHAEEALGAAGEEGRQQGRQEEPLLADHAKRLSPDSPVIRRSLPSRHLVREERFTMSRGKKLAALAALVCAATPCAAFDTFSQPQPGIKFYFSVPLDGRNAREQAFTAGFALQGRRDYEAIRIDSGMINNFIGGGIEAKWIIAGVVAAGAVVAVASKDKST